jgi:hypothetical protein
VNDSDSREVARLNAEGALRRKRLARNRRQREAYGPKHRRLRRQFAQRIERGDLVVCPRCSKPVGPDQNWDLGHDDYNPAIERPEHRECNRAAPNLLPRSREW